MIRYALVCDGGHKFEAWFSNSDAYDDQRKRRLVECPKCGTTKVSKQITAPAVSGTKKSKAARSKVSTKDKSPEAVFAEVASKVREHIQDTHEYVGDRFADEARAMHDGEAEERPVWGEASVEDVKDLADEGVEATPLPEPFAPKPPKKPKQLN